MGEPYPYGFIDALCWVTAMIAPALSLPAIFNLWRHGMPAQGQGARRSEPVAAALVCCLAWCYFGYQKDQAEPFRLNAWGALPQIIHLVTFLCLCTPEERKRAYISVLAGVFYLYATLVVADYASADIFKSMCTTAGLVSASAPLLTLAFLVDEWSIAMLPPWGMSCFFMLHCFAWWVRGFLAKDGPAYGMAMQNGLGAVCSFILLFLAFYWPPAPTAQDIDQGNKLRNPDLVQVAEGAGSSSAPPPAATQTEGDIKRAATDAETQADLLNQDLLEVATAAGTASAPPLQTQSYGHHIDIGASIAAEEKARENLLNPDLLAVAAGKLHQE